MMKKRAEARLERSRARKGGGGRGGKVRGRKRGQQGGIVSLDYQSKSD